MDTGAIVVSVVSVCAAVGGLIFGVVQIVRNKKLDDAKVGKEAGAVLTELGYIKAGIDDLKRKQDKQDEELLQLVRDLTAVQESAKQAHKRIDMIESRQ